MSNFIYDVFISHSSKDKVAVRNLAERLKSDGLKVWFDEWEIKPGDLIPLKINKGLEQSRILILVMSSNSSESDWVTFESQTILFLDIINKQGRVIPLRLDNSDIKPSIRAYSHIDWRIGSAEEYSKLLLACGVQAVTKSSSDNLSGFQQNKTFKTHIRTILCIAMSPDGEKVVSGSRDKTVKVWEVRTGKCIATFQGHIDGV